MNHRRVTLAAALAVLLQASAAHSATFRVDDSATLPHEASASLKWRQLAPTRIPDDTLQGHVTVQVRLNLTPWLNRNGRLFLVLPEQPVGPVHVSWNTQGRLLPGEVRSGQRTPVFAGPITTSLLEETLVLKIEVNGNRFEGTHRLQFHFEIDVE